MKRKVSKMVFRMFFSLCAVFMVCVLSSCAPSSPLFGTWSDNLGNKITFADDNTYTATIAITQIFGDNGEYLYPMTEMYSGTFSVAENALSLSTDYGTFVTEWDIRGSILYLDWTLPVEYGTEIKNLQLYHN